MSEQQQRGRTRLTVTFQQRGTTPTCVSAAVDVTPGPEPRPPVNGPIHPGWAAPGRIGREDGWSRAGLRAIVWLPRRWNPAGCEPLVRQRGRRAPEADAAREERGDSEFPGVPSSPLARQRPRIPPQKEAKTPGLPVKGLPEEAPALWGQATAPSEIPGTGWMLGKVEVWVL